MKKIWSFILCLVISLALTSVCLASDGADLNKQQQAVVKVFAALNGQNGMEYAGHTPADVSEAANRAG